MQIQFLKQPHWKNEWPWLFLLVVCVIGYWPIAFGMFSVKNDAIHYFLPFRYNISVAIRQGALPLWSPFIYLGYPVHGDMQSGAWNPFVWLISLFSRYNLTLFHIEYLLYIFISGVGLFKLSGLVTNNPFIKLFAATAYMLSGYMFGSGQFINWIASAAFIPFIIYYYYQFLLYGKLSATIATGIFCWLVLVCGYPADSIYMFYILFAMLLAGLWYKRKELQDRPYLKKFVWCQLLMIIVFIGLSAPALISYWELLPYYNRGTGTSYEQSVQNAFELKNTVSFLNPWPTWGEGFVSYTNPTGRNIFAGIYVVCFFIFSLFAKWDKVTRLLLALLIFSFLFSLGDGFLVRKAAYYLFPGMDSFRHPSHFRLYVLLPMILLAAKGFHNLINNKERRPYYFYIVFCLLSICIVITLYSYSPYVSSIFTQLPGFKGTQLKQWLSSFNKDILLFSGFVIQAIFLLALLLLIRRKSFPVRTMLLLHGANLLIFQALFPMNFVSKTNPATINKIISEAKSGYDPTTATQSLITNSRDAFHHFDDIGLSYFYSRKPAISKISNSPSFLSDMNKFLGNDSLYDYIAQRPVAYLTDSSNNFPGKINTITISYNQIEIQTEAAVNTILHLTQNFHHNWKAEVDGKPVAIHKANIAFMALSLEPGKHLVQWTYHPRFVYFGLIIFCITVICLIIFFLRTLLKNLHEK